MGWFEEAEKDDVDYAKEYLNISEDDSLNWGMMCVLWGSIAELTIVQGQDLLGLGTEARMNEPSTVGKNWQWRTLPDTFTEELAKKLRRKMQIYGRLDE